MMMEQKFEINNYPWDTTGYKPKTFLVMNYDEENIYIYMQTNEKNIRATETEHNSNVHCDSCMEAFFMFMPNEESYINFEVNPNGAMKCAIGKDRYNRVKYDKSIIDSFNIKTEITDDGWNVSYTIPVSFIKKEYPEYIQKVGKRIRANFYKCGDKTEIEHYGCWNNIEVENPDFHLSEYFGDIIL